VRLHADRVDDRVRAPAAGHLDQQAGGVIGLVQVDGLDAEPGRGGPPFGHRVNADDSLHAEVPGDPRRELPDGSEAEHGQRAVLGCIGEDHCLVGGGQDVGQEQVLLVRAVGRDLDRAELRLRDPQELRLPARDRPV